MEKSIIIVGAGIAGLSTGCYARMNGYTSTIFEMHDKPGGLCTAWKRKGYTWDISMHMLYGSRGGAFHSMWRELGALQGTQFVYHDRMGYIESGEKKLDILVTPGALEKQMLALSPADAALIQEFLGVFCGPGLGGASSLKPAEMNSLLDKLRTMRSVLPLVRSFRKYGGLTVKEFASRFQDPFLRTAVRFMIDSPGWPMIDYPLVGLSGFLSSSGIEAGVPIGGSQQVINKIAERYRALGGEVRYRTRVRDLIIEEDRVTGVRMEDGSEQRADLVIWAGDGHALIFDILGGRYINDDIRKMYEKWIPVKPLLHVCIGLNRDMSKIPNRMIFEIEKPLQIAGEDHKWLCFLHHSFDPTMAPAGKSSVEVWFATRYDYWQELREDRTGYAAEKKRIADATIAELDKRWPGFASQVEVVDVPTPATYHRYTGNWQGSPDGWYITAHNMRRSPLRALPGLANLQVVGQWTAPFTGTVIASLSGRQAIQLLCRQDKRRFVTTVPQDG
jgi:phytoene dehydrogenase-like protein